MKLPQLQYTGMQSPTGKPYIASPELVEAVNLAIYLQRPLLLKGEPGCGKTSLAANVADELGLPFERWPVKSTSRARDGLYLFDAIRRLHDAHIATAKPEAAASSLDLQRYVSFGPLGRAYKSERPTVVLIDEIDKADIDFPNDLLNELEEGYFVVDETHAEIRAQKPPIVFITSNDEKDLPVAFLRRCLFHYIEFPDATALSMILLTHFPDLPGEVAGKVVERFLLLREKSRDKKASTSELLDWVRVLRRHPQDKILSMLQGKLPYRSVLLKSWRDHAEYLSRAERN
jgi:MoxR-like ATPase